MQLRCAACALALGAAGGLFAARPASADFEMEERTAGYLFNYFADSDQVHVFSHYGDFDVDLTGGATMAVQWNHQVVVIPGISAPPGSDEAIDAISSASRPISGSNGAFESFSKRRNQVEADIDCKGASAGYYVSKESDYFAQQVRGNVSRDFLDKALNLSAGGSYGWDDIEPLDDDDTDAAGDSKRTLHWDVVATQVLTPTTVLRVGGEANFVDGLQHNPYRTVYSPEGNIAERHPDARTRRDVFFKLNQYLMNRSSVKLDYKFYTDDWGVESHTIGLGLNQYVIDDVVVGYRYRFYEQGSADFYREEYETLGGIDGYQTGDYRLSEFSAHLFGGQIDWHLGRAFRSVELLQGLSLNMKYERYFNSNNFSANIFESGLALAF